MMWSKRNLIGILIIILLIPVLIIGGFGLYGLSQAGKLPGQTQPTRIPITPVEMPGFGTIGGTPVSGSPIPSD